MCAHDDDILFGGSQFLINNTLSEHTTQKHANILV